MKIVTKPAEVPIDTEPRILDREHKQRLRTMVHLEKIKGTWANVLYTLRDCKRITRDQADAGDRYWSLTQEYRRLMATDPQDELSIRRVKTVKARHREAHECMGIVRKYVDEVVFENICRKLYPWSLSFFPHRLLGNSSLPCTTRLSLCRSMNSLAGLVSSKLNPFRFGMGGSSPSQAQSRFTFLGQCSLKDDINVCAYVIYPAGLNDVITVCKQSSP